MALSYPYKATFDNRGQSLIFEDGLQITVRGRSFDKSFEVTIDKTDADTIEGKEPLTAAYVFKDFKEPGGDDLLPPLANKGLLFTVPTLVQGTVAMALTLHSQPRGWPNPDEWTPKPDVDVDPIGGGKLLAEFDKLSTFQINQG